MNLGELRVFLLKEDTQIDPFDCGDETLNKFLFNEAKDYQTERLAVTHLVRLGGKFVAYFSLLNDKVEFNLLEQNAKSQWNRFNRTNSIPNPKRRRAYPAVKIGRLAVDKEFGGFGVGKHLIRVIQGIVLRNETVAFRFLTVDAYAAAIPFYIKNDFDFLSDKDINDNTRSLYLDLKITKNYPKI
jgi:GNAT superfamily N-acetyltransferase